MCAGHAVVESEIRSLTHKIRIGVLGDSLARADKELARRVKDRNIGVVRSWVDRVAVGCACKLLDYLPDGNSRKCQPDRGVLFVPARVINTEGTKRNHISQGAKRTITVRIVSHVLGLRHVLGVVDDLADALEHLAPVRVASRLLWGG